MKRSLTKDIVKDVIEGKTTISEASENSKRRLKLKIMDFIKSEQMSDDEPPMQYSVMVELKEDKQMFISKQQTASDSDAARTVFDEVKEFNPFTNDDTSIFVVLQDYEEEAIGAPVEVNLKALCVGEPYSVVIKESDNKFGELKISGEWLNVE